MASCVPCGGGALPRQTMTYFRYLVIRLCFKVKIPHSSKMIHREQSMFWSILVYVTSVAVIN